jgi:hypothetical protein
MSDIPPKILNISGEQLKPLSRQQVRLENTLLPFRFAYVRVRTISFRHFVNMPYIHIITIT